ncbi:MAG: hypothetical protein OEZ01_08220 [Candidatus Heimdallarchaeota archaeon]|nr:hypothetical protein [Candidatus Heimdallarchaeota archaeon]MDH5645978.1 hypothetical protein [Candidatus Heimdallarchaeota archaeon]
MINLELVEHKRFENSRNDNWWLRPFIQALTLTFFALYAMWAVVFDVEHHKSEINDVSFVSPFYSPEIKLDWWPENLSPGLILIWAPLGFRLTCYYARRVYYRAFFADPPSCAVGELRAVANKYKGETKLPWILNNLHRYFFYIAFILASIHVFSFVKLIVVGSLATMEGQIATLLLGLDGIFLALYVLSCHSCKHLVGGGLNCNSCSSMTIKRYQTWKFIKKLNTKHHWYFWLSLITILMADMYIRFILAAN